jgi:hypothetical protein
MSWITDLADAFATAAFNDPISFLLVLMGALLVGAASAVLGVLTLGALAEALTPDLSRGPPQ